MLLVVLVNTMIFIDGFYRIFYHNLTIILIAKLYKTFRFGAYFFIFFSTKISTFHNINSHKGLTIFECFSDPVCALLNDELTVFFVDN